MATEKFRIWYDEKEEVLRTEMHERLDPETADKFYTEFENYPPEQQHQVIGWLFDDAQKMYDKETRRIAKERAKALQIKKMAVCGAKSAVRIVASVVISAIGKSKDTKFCSTDEEALAWIREQKELDKKQEAEVKNK